MRCIIRGIALLHARTPYYSGKWRVVERLLRYVDVTDFKGIIRRRGLLFDCDCHRNVTDQHLAWRGYCELAELRAAAVFIRQDDTVLDVGGNIGCHAMEFGRMVGPRGHVTTFEPDPKVFSRLQCNLALNNMPWIEARCQALADRCGTQSFVRAHYQGQGFLASGRATDLQVETVTLDDFCRNLDVNRLRFVKIDVEGGEERVLKGGMVIFETRRPVLMMEFNVKALERSGSSVERVKKILNELGYKIFGIGLRGRLQPLECFANNPDRCLRNVLAIP